jgi:ArsR family transcriptional regulator
MLHSYTAGPYRKEPGLAGANVNYLHLLKHFNKCIYICIVIHFFMDAKKAEKISKALADPNRLTILREIKKSKQCLYCVDLNEMLNLAQPSIAHHLKLLLESELVTSDKEGRNVRYYLNNKLMDEYIRFIEGLKV